MTTEKRDYSKLRPFDREAAKRGDKIHDVFGGAVVFIDGPDAGGRFALRIDGHFAFAYGDQLRMAPLAWVRKSADEDVLWPVYKGDRLYWVTDESWIVAHEFVPAGQCIGKNGAIKNDDGPLSDVAWLENITFTPPKVKREGWMNIYPVHGMTSVANGDSIWPDKRHADGAASPSRIACIRIEWDEPAGQEGGAQ
jgi:hypothetical protein